MVDVDNSGIRNDFVFGILGADVVSIYDRVNIVVADQMTSRAHDFRRALGAGILEEQLDLSSENA